jgi:hypothetical protein
MPLVTEAATDLLAQVLFQIANCDPVKMIPFPQRSQFEVKVTLLTQLFAFLLLLCGIDIRY